MLVKLFPEIYKCSIGESLRCFENSFANTGLGINFTDLFDNNTHQLLDLNIYHELKTIINRNDVRDIIVSNDTIHRLYYNIIETQKRFDEMEKMNGFYELYTDKKNNIKSISKNINEVISYLRITRFDNLLLNRLLEFNEQVDNFMQKEKLTETKILQSFLFDVSSYTLGKVYHFNKDGTVKKEVLLIINLIIESIFNKKTFSSKIKPKLFKHIEMDIFDYLSVSPNITKF